MRPRPDAVGPGRRNVWDFSRPAIAEFCAAHVRIDHVAFYAAPFDRYSVDGDTVVPQPGAFYGGWITSDLAGPFKGIPGSMGW